MPVFDVLINGETMETIYPQTSRLQDIHRELTERKKQLRREYGDRVVIVRRFIYLDAV